MARKGGLTPLKLPTLPKLGTRKRKPPRPEYSVDIQGDRRKRKRITIEELSEHGAKILKERAPDLPRIDKRSLFTKVTDILDIPRNVIANAIAAASGMDVSKKRKGTLLKKVYMSDILDKAGVPKSAARSIIGFVGDAAIDPLTYASLGGTAGLKIAKHLPRMVGAGAKGMKTAAHTGRMTAELAKALGTTTTKYSAMYGRLVAKHGAAKARKILLQRGGGVLQRLLAKRTTKGASEALEIMAKYGEKARPLFRAPFASKGVIGLPGKRAARYKDLLQSLTQKGQEAHHAINSLQASVAAQLAKQTSKTAQASELDLIYREATKNLKAAQNKYSQYLKAESAARKIGYPGTKATKTLVGSSALRKAKRDVDIWKQIQSQVRKKYASRKTVTELKSKYEVSKTAESVMERAMPKPVPSWKQADKATKLRTQALAKAKKGAPRITQYPVGKQRFRTPLQLSKTEMAAAKADASKAKILKAESASAGKLAAEKASELARFKTSPEAPGVIKQLVKSQIGPGERKGVLGALTRTKQTIFGAPVTPVRQKAVAAHQQMGPFAAAAGGREIAAFNQKITPIVQKYVAAGKGTEDEIGKLIHHLAEAGPNQARLKDLPLTDALHNFVTKAKKSGLADDPAVKNVLAEYWQSAEATRKLTGASKIEGFTPGLLTPGTRKIVKGQARRGMSAPYSKQRARRLTFELPGQEPVHFASTGAGAKGKIAKLKKLGYKQTKAEGISHAQMNVAAIDPKTRQTLLGPGEGGPLFKESLSETAGSLVRTRQRELGYRQVDSLSKKYRVNVPRGTSEASERFAHLSRPIVRNNPVYKGLERNGIVGKDIAYPRQVTDIINGQTEVYDSPEMIEAILHGTDKMLGWWKGFQLYHPAYVIRNAFQNLFGGIMAGANPIDVSRRAIGRDVEDLRKALVTGNTAILAGRTATVSGRNVPLNDIARLLKAHNAVGAGRSAEITTTIGKQSVSRALAGQGKKGAKAVTSAVFKGNAHLEDNMRIATFMHFADKGMDMESAFMRTLKAMPDLTDLTMFEQQKLARIFPWYRWMRRNGALQLFHYLPQKPAYAAMLPRFKNFVEGFRGKDNVPEELRPMWMEEQAAIQITGDKESGTVGLAQTWFPFEETYMLLGSPIQPEESMRRLVSSVRPGMKFAAEAATGTDIFKRTPREPIGGITGAIPKIPAALAGRSGTALDTLAGLRPVREWGPGGRVSDMPTAGEKVQRAVIGGAIQPVDYGRGLKAKYYELNNQQRQLRSQINRAAQVNDQALVESLTRQWLAIIQQMHQWRFPLPRTLEQKLQSLGLPQTGPP